MNRGFPRIKSDTLSELNPYKFGDRKKAQKQGKENHVNSPAAVRILTHHIR
jgi:hypothetical protein